MGTTTLVMVTVNGSSTSTSTIQNFPFYDGPNFHEWVFIACVFLGFISLAGWRFIFRSAPRVS